MTDNYIRLAIQDPERLASVRATSLLDSGPDGVFDRLTRLAARLTAAPVTFISMVDESRDFYLSCVGFPEPLASERQLEGQTFCHLAIASEHPLVIEDTMADPVYRNIPTVRSLGIRAYLGVPMITAAGHAIGSFCAVDFQARAWTELQIDVMRELAASTTREIELRQAIAASASARQGLESAQRLMAATIQQIPIGIMAADASGKMFLSNDLSRQILGPDVAYALESWMMDGSISEQDIDIPNWPLARALRSGERVIDEEISFVRTPDGQQRIVDVNAAPIYGDDNVVLGAVATIYDATSARTLSSERLYLLATLEAERSRLRTVLEHVPAGVLMAESSSGRVTIANRQAAEILGRPVPEMSYEQYVQEVPAMNADGTAMDEVDRPLARALAGEIIHGYEMQYRRKDGRTIWIRVHSAPVRDADDRIVGGIAAFHDIDDERKMRLENERLYEEARNANKAKDDFFAAVSHELRTPMTAILGWARLMREEVLTSPLAAEAVEAISSSASLQAQLVDDLLDVARISSGKIVLEPSALSLNEVIVEVTSAAQPSASSKQVRLVMDLRSIPPVQADRARFRQIMGNLISNAVKFTPAGGLIEVSSRAHDQSVLVTVCDTGRGMRAETLATIFQRGHQAKNGEYGGLGLGLAIVKHLVDLHGGSITAESGGEGKGTTFSLTLPLKQEAT